MSTFTQKLRTFLKSSANELLDKAVDMNSTPMLRQYVRDLEEGIAKTEHECAVIRASATTLNRQAQDLGALSSHDKVVAAAFLAKDDQPNARLVAGRIHDRQIQLDALSQQAAVAADQAIALTSVLDKLNTKHQQVVSQLRMLESKDRSSKALEAATSSLKGASNLMSGGADVSVDNISEKINARNDIAQEEFRETAAKFEEPPDPTRDAAVDDILASLKK